MKKFLLLFATAFAGCCVFAEYLNFQVVSDGANNNLYYVDGNYYFNGKQVIGANIKATADGGATSTSLGFAYGGNFEEAYIGPGVDEPTLLVEYGDIIQKGDLPSPGDVALSVDLTELGENYGSYSYYIELVGYDSAAFGDQPGVIGVGDMFAYSDLGSFTYGDEVLSPPQIWTGGAYNVPEPSGALLMLMGLALAGLKRRKV